MIAVVQATTTRRRPPTGASSTGIPSTGVPRTRAPRTEPAERRAQLLDTAERLLVAGGTDALRMDHVARAAGVTRPVVYEHFGNRDGLVIALLERHAQRIAEHQPHAARDTRSFEERLRDATRAYLTIARTHGPALRALLDGGDLSPAVEQARRSIRARGVHLWSGRYREHRRLTPADARALATSHLAALSALAGLCSDGRLTIARAVDLHVTTTLAALDAVVAGGRA